MNTEKEEIRTSRYEVLCMIKETESDKKDALITELENIITPEKIKFESKVRKLAYTIDKLDSADYLLLNFTTEKNKIVTIEELLKRPFIIRYMLINLDSEKKIVIKPGANVQRARRPRRANFDKSFVKQEKKDWHPRKSTLRPADNEAGTDNTKTEVGS